MGTFEKHFFLTGNIQVGKSTILKAIIDANPDCKLGGLFTRWIEKNNAAAAGLYLFPADRRIIEAVWGACYTDREDEAEPISHLLAPETNLIAAFDSGNYRKKIVHKEVFDTLGRQYLKKAKKAELILIDEIGILEDKSYAFQEEVLRLLDGTVPVIGVVRNKPGVLTDAVKNHPKVELVEVTRKNRNEIKDRLIAYFKEHDPKEKEAGQ